MNSPYTPEQEVDLAQANAHAYWDEISDEAKLEFPNEFFDKARSLAIRLSQVKTWKYENPPQDGTRFIAVGQVTERFGDWGTVVDPFAREIFWSAPYKCWLDAYSELAISPCAEAEVKIFHWIELPSVEKSKSKDACAPAVADGVRPTKEGPGANL